MVQKNTLKQFPVVKASGSHYEVGVAIGQSLAKPIADLLRMNAFIFEESYENYLEEITPFLGQARTYFPKYIEELRGIANGAGVSFEELFLANNREVADYNPNLLSGNHCTIIGIPVEHGYLVGHNEDWSQSARAFLYVLDAVIDGNHIFGLNYAHEIMGSSVGINGWGLVQAINELSHQGSQLGVPKNFIARAILDCRTLEEAERIMETIPRAAGFNHVLVAGQRLWNIESSATDYVIEKIAHSRYVHTNHYVTRLRGIDPGNTESKNRYDKVSRGLPEIASVDDLIHMLSDRSEPVVCRPETIGSVIFDTAKKDAYVAFGQPVPESYIKYAGVVSSL
ncbi:MAG: C45 family peptidase [bacterium]|nr:C45 family peptidase [bacterium]